MDGSSESFQINGFYTQPYNEIVHPERVWRVPKYFLRRWGPYLTPSRFWAVVAARQFAYWNDKSKCFTVYDRRFAQEARLSTIHFRRIRAEMEQVSQPLSLFLSREQLAEKDRYHVINGQTKPKPTTYYVRLDDPLTPADAYHLSSWLQRHNQQRRAEAIVALLQEARNRPRTELLAPTLAPYLTDMPAQFRYQSILDVVTHLYGSKVAQNKQVKQEADTLHVHLTGLDYYGKEYFRINWLNILKPGPAFLLTYLRSLCFHDEQTGELRNEVTFTRPDLAGKLGVTTRTLVNWLRKIEQSVPDQTISPFVTLLDQRRISSNDVWYKYRIEMLEPLIETDLHLYSKRIEFIQVKEQPAPEGKNDSHDSVAFEGTEGKNDDHDFVANGKNDSHGLEIDAGNGKYDNYDLELMEKMSRAKGFFDDRSWKKRWPFKYYQSLIQSVTDEDIKTLVTAADWSPYWKINNNLALQPFAYAACDNDYNKLFDLMGVDKGGPSRKRMMAGGLGIDEIVAWYLYATCQKGLSKPPVNMTIARVQSGKRPPNNVLKLARLSWELWRCYASLLILHPNQRDTFDQAPDYDLWMKQYGRYHPDHLPFQVGVGVSETMNTILYGVDGAAVQLKPMQSQMWAVNKAAPNLENGPEALQMLWRPVMREIKESMTLATFNTWLKDTELLNVEENDKVEGCQHWIVGVRNSYAKDWLTNRLNKRIIEPVATAVHERSITIDYVVQ
ncbi:MAG: hypothetical protein GY796_09035 [Chloroflexi bacterium]|nr:hypothetical protein [Chloroflexota bacterium]